MDRDGDDKAMLFVPGPFRVLRSDAVALAATESTGTMTRPHIEFIFAQALDWQEQGFLPGREDLMCKLLSEDAMLGEATLLLRFPAGWAGDIEARRQEELYVLEGGLAIRGQSLGRDGYFRVAAGSRLAWRSEQGGVALLFLNAGPPTDAEELVAIDTTSMDWDRGGIPTELDFMGLARKALFQDRDTGLDRTWLLSVSPQIAPRGGSLATETHSCVEEMYMMSGDIIGPHGRMTPGAYFWRPRDILHGPFGSREGGLALFRWRHGDQETRFHAQAIPFRFDAPYRPNLPEDLQHLAGAVPIGADRF